MGFDSDKLTKYFELRAQASAGNSIVANGYANSPEDSTDILYNEIFIEISRRLPINEDSKVLDVGCGTGEILARLNRCCASAVGIDLSAEMVKIAQQKGLVASSYTGNDFPFPSSSFDIVIIYSVYINLPDLAIATHILEEAFRVVRKGGYIMIGAVPHPRRSKLPRNFLPWVFSFKNYIRSMIMKSPTIPYYSYDYQFFVTASDRLGTTGISFYPCTVSRSGWETKYHVIMER